MRVPSEQTGSVARCYSLSSSPHAGDRPAITVKRTDGGYASNWIHDHITAGSVLDLLAPAGTFVPNVLDADFLLFAAGSGITPVMSILKSALAAGRGRVVLVYANRDERSVIFGAALRDLVAASAGRLTVVHWLDSLLGRAVGGGDRGAGPARTPRHEAFICGPDPWVITGPGGAWPARRAGQAGARGAVPVAGGQPVRGGCRRAAGGPEATLAVTLEDGATKRLPWPAGVRMLDVLIEAGLDAPFSCRQGICGACACQLTGGEVEMAHNEVLEQADLDEGYILACQAVPLTPEVSITY